MFGKLLKNDLKSQFHSMFPIFLTIGVIIIALETAIAVIDSTLLKVFGALGVSLALFFTCIYVLIKVGSLFSQTLYGRAGYLSLTLPVKTSSLIWSKTITGIFWEFLSFALFCASLVLACMQLKEIVGEDALSSAEMLLSLFGVPTFKMLIINCVYLLIDLLVIVILVIQASYLGITIAHVKPFSKFGFIGTLVVLFTATILIYCVSTSFRTVIPVGMIVTKENIMFTGNVIHSALSIDTRKIIMTFSDVIFRFICALLLHYPIAYLTKHKVNVQ